MKKLIISVVVGYTLKVLKSGIEIIHHKKEFDAIRHGDYVKFINLVNGPIPFIVTYNAGQITSGNIPPSNDDINFALLMKAGPSLKTFYASCIKTYGVINDEDVSDYIFESAALFEISLRMHASNKKLISPEDTLEAVINKLGNNMGFRLDQLNKLHLGRKFLKMIKHKKQSFTTWGDGFSALEGAILILQKYSLTVE